MIKNFYYKVLDFYLWCAFYFRLNKNKKLKVYTNDDRQIDYYKESFMPWNYSNTFQEVLRCSIDYNDQNMPTMWLYWNILCETMERFHYVMNEIELKNDSPVKFNLDYTSKEKQKNLLESGDWDSFEA